MYNNEVNVDLNLLNNQDISVHYKMYECNGNVEDILKEVMLSCHKAKSPNTFSSDGEDSFSSEYFDLLEDSISESKDNSFEKFKIQRSYSTPILYKKK